MKHAITVFLALTLGAGVGIGSALYMTGVLGRGVSHGENVGIDGWHADWSLGSEAADPYVKAWVARFGLLALQKTEAVYFIKAQDNDGAPLQEACSYRVSGGVIPGEWWSLTLYDETAYLPLNDDNRLSFVATDAADPSNWSFVIGSDGQADVSSRNAGLFDLLLRIYRPDAALLEAPASSLAPPTIEKLTCAEGV